MVDMQAVGVNYADVYNRAGVNRGPRLLRTIGMEGAGVVISVGQGVTQEKEGDVVAYCSVQGSYAQQAVVPAARLIKMPQGLDVRDGAAAMLQGMTAHYLCYSTYPVGEKLPSLGSGFRRNDARDAISVVCLTHRTKVWT